MNIVYTFDVKDNLLSSAVRLSRFVKAEFTLPGVKAEKTVSRNTAVLHQGAIRGYPDNTR